MQLSNTLGDARKLAALCTPWARDVIVCYDPTTNFPPQFQGQWVWVEAVGANILPVAASVPDEWTFGDSRSHEQTPTDAKRPVGVISLIGGYGGTPSQK